MDDDVTLKFVEEPISHLRCPICKKCYKEPVINISCGHTFCKRCTNTLQTCPIDSLPCDIGKLVVNRLVVGQIDELFIYCPFGLILQNDEWVVDPSGCPEKFPLGSLDQHKAQCQFVPVLCPNNGDCGMFKSQDLNGHMQQCSHTKCPNYSTGCEFRGIPSAVSTHVADCVFASNFNNADTELKTKTQMLEKSNLNLQKEVNFLKEKIVSLESSRNEISSQLNTCIGSINSLQQKFDSLHSMVEQSMVTRSSRRSFSSQSQNETSGSTSRLSSASYSPTSSPTNYPKLENWMMPFQFKCIGTLRGHQDVVWCLTVHHGKLYSAGSDSIIKVWDLDSLAKGCFQNMQGHKKMIHCSCIGGGNLYTAGDDLSVRQWDLQTGTTTQVIENAHDNTICSMLIHDDHLFTSSFSLIKVWNRTTLTLKHSMSGLHHWVRAMAFSPKKEWLYSGSHNVINIWDTITFESVGTIEHNLGSIYSLAVTKQYVIAGSYNQNIQLFDVKTNEEIIKLEGHFGAITSLVPSPSGKFLFSGSHDHNVQMWNLENHLPIQTLSRHQGSVNTIALYGNILLSGSEDHEIKVYRYFQSPV
ncbi:hypothetical protein SNE40_007693 [Patella caerulea]|uniref:Uncharacterized protein n=1 Tax=Patella caerulea TaxID=87958 RepID=A0AAN8JZI9_PATCE